jgi:hypothetical protein
MLLNYQLISSYTIILVSSFKEKKKKKRKRKEKKEKENSKRKKRKIGFSTNFLYK